jgi:hypothetical protein
LRLSRSCIRKAYKQEIVRIKQWLAVTWVPKSIGKSIGNLFFIVDVEARVMKPAATAASQSRGLIGPGIGHRSAPIGPLRQVDVIPAQIAGL